MKIGIWDSDEMLSRIGFKNIKINSLRYLTQAGGKLERKILNEINNFCKKNELKFFSMYGQTEASPRISYLKPFDTTLFNHI